MTNKVLLIDGNNLAFRVHWTHKNLTHNDMSVSLLYGFMRSMISFRKRFEDHFPVVVWDAGYTRRKRESEHAVLEGIIPSAYKANRKRPKKGEDEDIDPMLESLFQQLPPLREGLKLCRVMQVQVKGIEADDIIHTYAKDNSKNGIESLIITSDKDYYQLLNLNGITLYDAMKSNYWNKEVFVDNYGIDPSSWVDVGALAGDVSDNIHGVPGIGDVWATRLVKEYGDIDGILNGLRAKEKLKKKEQSVLDNEKRLRLAYSLKMMDYIEDLPSYRCAPRQLGPLQEWFASFNFGTLKSEAWRLI